MNTECHRMNTSQRQCCINCNSIHTRKYILGVFAADQLPLNLAFPCGAIANTYPYDKKGSHWCVSFFFHIQSLWNILKVMGNL